MQILSTSHSLWYFTALWFLRIHLLSVFFCIVNPCSHFVLALSLAHWRATPMSAQVSTALTSTPMRHYIFHNNESCIHSQHPLCRLKQWKTIILRSTNLGRIQMSSVSPAPYSIGPLTGLIWMVRGSRVRVQCNNINTRIEKLQSMHHMLLFFQEKGVADTWAITCSSKRYGLAVHSVFLGNRLIKPSTLLLIWPHGCDGGDNKNTEIIKHTLME